MRFYIFAFAFLFSGAAFAASPTDCSYASQTWDGQQCVAKVPDACPQQQYTATINKGGMSISTALAHMASCDEGRITVPKGGNPVSKSEKASAKACNKRFRATPDNCMPYAPADAASAKKEVDSLNDKINEAKNNAIKDEQNFQQQSQELTKEKANAVTQLSSTIPANEHIEQNNDYIESQKAISELDDKFREYQNQYTQAQASYANQISSISTTCYTQAVAAYKDQKAAIDKLRQGNGVSVSSARLTVLESALKTYQARKMAECMNSTAGVDQQNQAKAELASQQTQLANDVAGLNKQRSRVNSQLQVTLDSMQAKYKDLTYKAVMDASQAETSLAALSKSHTDQLSNQQNMIITLTQQRDLAQLDADCIEKAVGRVSKDADRSNSDANDAIAAATDLLNGCTGYKHEYSSAPGCKGLCEGVIKTEEDLARKGQGDSLSVAVDGGPTNETTSADAPALQSTTKTAVPTAPAAVRSGSASGTNTSTGSTH